MGVVLSDFAVEGVLRAGITAIRDNPARLDDLFSNMLEDYMSDHFGQTALNNVKSWFAGNRINIVQAFPQNLSEIPALSITLQGATEATELAVLSDYAQQVDTSLVSVTPIVSFTPTGYDNLTGKIRVSDGVDLSGVEADVHLFSDVAGHTFIVLSVDNTVGNKGVFIDSFQTVNISSTCKVIPSLDFSRASYNMIPIHENILIGCHTESAILTKWLYYITVYILQFRRNTLIRRWLELTKFQATDFMREAQMLPENIYSRFIVLSGITRFYYKTEEDNLASGSDIIIRVPKDEFPRTDEDQFTVRNTTT